MSGQEREPSEMKNAPDERIHRGILCREQAFTGYPLRELGLRSAGLTPLLGLLRD